MNGKQEKKLRKLAKVNTRQAFGAMEQAVLDRLAEICKPCPKWCPRPVWKFMQGRFLNID